MVNVVVAVGSIHGHNFKGLSPLPPDVLLQNLIKCAILCRALMLAVLLGWNAVKHTFDKDEFIVEVEASFHEED